MPDLNFSIRLVDQDGDPIEDKSIQVLGKGLFNMYSEKSTTDEDGWAQFSTYFIQDDSITVSIYAGGQEIEDEYTFDDGDTASFTIAD